MHFRARREQPTAARVGATGKWKLGPDNSIRHVADTATESGGSIAELPALPGPSWGSLSRSAGYPTLAMKGRDRPAVRLALYAQVILHLIQNSND